MNCGNVTTLSLRIQMQTYHGDQLLDVIEL